MKKLKLKHFINYIIIVIALFVTCLLNFTDILAISSKGVMRVTLEKMGISILLAVSLGLVVGFLGELSLGHAGFMCIGAYIGGLASKLLEPSLGNGIANLVISLVVGGIAAAISGVIIGIPALRLKGDYLAIVTLAFGEIVKTIFLNTDSKGIWGGAMGMKTPRYNRAYLFIFIFIVVLFMLFIIQNLIRSKHGRAITAIRDSELAAKATGINVTQYKLLVFALSAFFAGMAGVFYSYSNSYVQCTKFDYNYSIEILVMVVLGGMGNNTGTIISASLITFLQVKLSSLLTGDLAVLQNVLYALILVIIVIYNNAPALKGFREKYNFKNLINRFRKPKPEVEKDDEAKWDRVPTKIEMNEVVSLNIKNNTNEGGKD